MSFTPCNNFKPVGNISIRSDGYIFIQIVGTENLIVFGLHKLFNTINFVGQRLLLVDLIRVRRPYLVQPYCRSFVLQIKFLDCLKGVSQKYKDININYEIPFT